MMIEETYVGLLQQAITFDSFHSLYSIKHVFREKNKVSGQLTDSVSFFFLNFIFMMSYIIFMIFTYNSKTGWTEKKKAYRFIA